MSRFQWHARGVLLLASPLAASAQARRYVRVDVAVQEETTPGYALVFTLTTSSAARVQRRVTKQLMARVFEQAIAQPRGRVATLRTRVLDQSGRVFDDAVDGAVRDWICGETAQPPSREQLVKWLLSRMLLDKTKDGWTLVLCGEEEQEDGSDDEEDAGKEDSGGVERKELQREAIVENVENEMRSSSPPPPPYSAGGGRSERAFSDVSDYPGFFEDMMGGDQGEAQESDHDSDDCHEQSQGQRTSQAKLGTTPSNTGTLSRPSSKGKLTATDLVDSGDGEYELPAMSKFRFEPATVRMQSQRRYSHSGSLAPPNAWTEERHHFQLELTQSKRDLEIAQERQRKAEAIASLRRKQTIEQSQKKLLAHEQKLRDARFVKQSIADTLEYHEIAHRMGSQLKQTAIAASRDQERLSQSMRVALGRSGEKWRKGPVLGAGPLSQIEIDLLTKGDRKSSVSSMWVYDLHGRRHHESDAGAVAAQNVFDTAMKKIQRLLDRKPTESVDLFRKYDLDGNGTLEYAEFQHLLVENGVALSNEQAKTLFRHFDPNRSGAIDYGELLWGFFNRRAFLKRWRHRKTKMSAREIKLMFYKYDRVGRGALSPVDFQLALDDIGFRVSESEAKLLCLKFDVNKDGFIDYNEFHAFVNDDVDVDTEVRSTHTTRGDHSRIGINASQTMRASELEQPVKLKSTRRRFSTGAGTIDDNSSDMERILAELRSLNETQSQIHRSITIAR